MRRETSPPTPSTRNARFLRVDAVFEAALDLPTAEQVEYIERTCHGDPVVRTEVLQLLEAHHRVDGILDLPIPRVDARIGTSGSPSGERERNATGIRIGPFRIDRAIGHGGMGQVYLGVRDDGHFDQRVALKLIRHPAPGLVRRFLEERRILARLEHPGVARLVDGGITDDGMPYFAMEFVDGEPIDAYCTSRNLTIEARLALFEQVCDAVSYAHHHLVVHRDLKPGNILVTPGGQVKLLDFGIAKVMDTAGGFAVDQTRTGALVMTPDVAAPEQVLGHPVSTATDVYALGILLYQLLSGVRPYDLDGCSLVEIQRIICEYQPPPPSTKAPQSLKRHIDSDLDLIVMTALQKREARRYQSAGELARDLQRLRQGFAIHARADSAAYRFRKFTVRHRAVVLVAATLAVATVFGAYRERHLRQNAELAAQTSAAVQEFLISVFDVADPLSTDEASGAAVTAQELTERGTKRVDSLLAGQPAVQAELRTALGRVYTNLGMFDEAGAMLERALDQRTQLPGVEDTAMARTMDLLGEVRTRQNRYAEAERLLRDALTRRRARLGRLHPATAESVNNLATLFEETGDLAAAESLHVEALAIKRELFGLRSVESASSMNNLGLVKYRRGAYAAAESLYRAALDIDREKLGDNHPEIGATMHNLAQTLAALGKMNEAEDLYRRSLSLKRVHLGDAHPSITIGLNNLGMFLAIERQKTAEAESLVREALALDRENLGPTHSYVAEGLRNLGIVQRVKGEFVASDTSFQAAIRIQRMHYDTDNERMATLYSQRAQSRYMMGDDAGAIRLSRDALRIYRATLGSAHRNSVIMMGNVGRLLAENGAGIEAEALAREAIAQLDSANTATRATYVSTLRVLGDALLVQGKVDDAVAVLKTAYDMARAQHGIENVRTAHAALSYGSALAARGRAIEARALLQAAHRYFDGNRSSQPRLAAKSAMALSKLDRTLATRGS